MIKDVILSSQTINKKNKVKKELVDVFSESLCVRLCVYSRVCACFVFSIY